MIPTHDNQQNYAMTKEKDWRNFADLYGQKFVINSVNLIQLQS